MVLKIDGVTVPQRRRVDVVLLFDLHDVIDRMQLANWDALSVTIQGENTYPYGNSDG
jgi:hypothetical protein